MNIFRTISCLTLTLLILSCGTSKKEQTPSDKVEETESIIAETQSLPYMNEFQKNIKNALMKGQISQAKYKELLDNDNSVYTNSLAIADWSKLDIYTDAYNTDGSTSLSELTDKMKKRELRDILFNAIREDRVMWHATISGEMYGPTLIVLPKAVDGEIKGVNRGMVIFIAGLFEKSIMNAFGYVNQDNDSI